MNQGKRFFHIVVAWTLLNGAVSQAQSASEGCAGPIPETIRAALQGRGVIEEDLPAPGDVSCPMLPRQAASQAFEVRSIRWDAVLRSLEFQVRCADAKRCLPFVVRVQTLQKKHLQAAADRRSVRGTVFRKEQEEFTPALPKKGRSLEPVLVKPGQSVVLLWESNGLKIRRKMVCLDRAAQGQQVRIRGREGGPVLLAVVMAVGLVRLIA
ncbi:MAG TPA: flagella basal body P-ring formation protein FlgA [Terriglobales bacterium]|jgi:hypothetical protein